MPTLNQYFILADKIQYFSIQKQKFSLQKLLQFLQYKENANRYLRGLHSANHPKIPKTRITRDHCQRLRNPCFDNAMLFFLQK